jgi:1-deoxy-D-xylulose-5-phosphate reductoisomerase
VEYIDNCIVGEFSVPDMRMCIQYAVDYPERCVSTSEELDLFKVGSLTFHAPDPIAFPLLELARRTREDGGASGAVLNAADEIAVEAFLNERISFSEISRVVIGAYESLCDAKNEHSLEAILEYDAVARAKAEELIKK